MIQRIQTVYLFLAVVCMVVGLCTTVGHFHQNGVETMAFHNLYLEVTGGERIWSPWALFVVLVLSAVSSLVAIFLFKKRMLQVRLTVVSSLLLIGYYIICLCFQRSLCMRFYFELDCRTSCGCAYSGLFGFQRNYAR